MRLVTGQLTITGSAQALTTTPLEADYICLKMHRDNLDTVRVGLTGVTLTTGYFVDPGDEFEVDNETRSGETSYDLQPHQVFVVGTSGDKLSWLAWVR